MEQVINIQTAVITKASRGDRAAQSWLYEQYSKAMFNICSRMTGNRADAEDLLQESFLIAFINLGQLKDPNQFGGWLKRIVVNECIRFSKKNFYWDDWDESNKDTLVTEDIEWWKTVDFKVIHQEIKSLPDGCRQVFNLYVLEDYPHKEIADKLGISESTSKSQYHRAKQLLKERITKQLMINGSI
ncbi:MAG: sigma-70 family RNA polymerase sigma factor [Sediminibacterium sp.]|nr:sigma-70 family RNA polymerase sigma factor [Sediminibacterium sp.]